MELNFYWNVQKWNKTAKLKQQQEQQQKNMLEKPCENKNPDKKLMTQL